MLKKTWTHFFCASFLHVNPFILVNDWLKQRKRTIIGWVWCFFNEAEILKLSSACPHIIVLQQQAASVSECVSDHVWGDFGWILITEITKSQAEQVTKCSTPEKNRASAALKQLKCNQTGSKQ